MDVVRTVFAKTGKIKRIFRKIRNPANACRKTIYKSIFFQRAADKDLNAIAFSPIEARI